MSITYETKYEDKILAELKDNGVYDELIEWLKSINKHNGGVIKVVDNNSLVYEYNSDHTNIRMAYSVPKYESNHNKKTRVRIEDCYPKLTDSYVNYLVKINKGKSNDRLNALGNLALLLMAKDHYNKIYNDHCPAWRKRSDAYDKGGNMYGYNIIYTPTNDGNNELSVVRDTIIKSPLSFCNKRVAEIYLNNFKDAILKVIDVLY